eukprot:768013-Hanusia_phi.AAC.12
MIVCMALASASMEEEAMPSLDASLAGHMCCVPPSKTLYRLPLDGSPYACQSQKQQHLRQSKVRLHRFLVPFDFPMRLTGGFGSPPRTFFDDAKCSANLVNASLGPARPIYYDEEDENMRPEGGEGRVGLAQVDVLCAKLSGGESDHRDILIRVHVDDEASEKNNVRHEQKALDASQVLSSASCFTGADVMILWIKPNRCRTRNNQIDNFVPPLLDSFKAYITK